MGALGSEFREKRGGGHTAVTSGLSILDYGFWTGGMEDTETANSTSDISSKPGQLPGDGMALVGHEDDTAWNQKLEGHEKQIRACTYSCHQVA